MCVSPWISREVALPRALRTTTRGLNSTLGVWTLLSEGKTQLFLCYLKDNSDIKEMPKKIKLLSINMSPRYVCVFIYNHNYRYKVFTKQIKTPLKQLSFPSVTSPENMEKFWRLSTMKESPYGFWFTGVLFPFLLFHSPWFCVVSIGKCHFKTQPAWEILQHISSDVFVVYEKYLQITHLVRAIGNRVVIW